MITKNNIGTYPGIYRSQRKSTGCRSCGQSRSSLLSTKSNSKNMSQSPEAKAYMSAKFERINEAAERSSNTVNTPVRPSINPKDTSNTKVTPKDINPMNKLKANIHTDGIRSATNGANTHTGSNNTSLQNYDTPISPTNTPVPQRINPTSTKQLPHFDAPEITDSNWNMIINGIARPLVILFSTPYCGACRDFKATTWQEAYWKYNDKLVFFEFKCTPVTKQDKEHDALSHPTVVIYQGGEEKGIYLGHSIFQYFEDYLKQLKLV